jgi:CRISPR-associated protein Cst1
MSSPIRYVGDPFVDAGVAVLEVRLNKPVDEFTMEDLDRQGRELEKIYAHKVWKGFLTVHFPNGCWCNFTMKEGRINELKELILRSFEYETLTEKDCVYCLRGAVTLADRSLIPLLSGADTMSSGALGTPGLPVCSACLFAVQFYPLGSLKAEGKPLFWWAADHSWMYALTRDSVRRVEQVLVGSSDQFPSIRFPATRLFEALKEVLETAEDLPAQDLVGCHATNYGSGPDYEELTVSRGIVAFFQEAKQFAVFKSIIAAGREIPKKKKKDVEESTSEQSSPKNFFFEALGRGLRRDGRCSPSIVRRYFTPQVRQQKGVYELAEKFAEKVFAMTKEQVTAVKQLAAFIAESAKAKDHLDRLFRRQGNTAFIRSLTEISGRLKRAEEKPIPLALILTAFDIGNLDDPFMSNGSLVRELILLRVIELIPAKDLPEKMLDSLTEDDGKQEKEKDED